MNKAEGLINVLKHDVKTALVWFNSNEPERARELLLKMEFIIERFEDGKKGSTDGKV